MPNQRKEFDDDAIQDIIKGYTNTEQKRRIPSTTELRKAYEEETGESVNNVTFRRYLTREEAYRKVQISDYFGWEVVDR